MNNRLGGTHPDHSGARGDDEKGLMGDVLAAFPTWLGYPRSNVF